MPRRPTPERVYQLDIRLIGIEPPIWRRITVSDQIPLASLHHVLQVVVCSFREQPVPNADASFPTTIYFIEKLC